MKKNTVLKWLTGVLLVVLLLLILRFMPGTVFNVQYDPPKRHEESVREVFDRLLEKMSQYREEGHWLWYDIPHSIKNEIPLVDIKDTEYIALQAYLDAYYEMYSSSNTYWKDSEYAELWGIMNVVPEDYDGYCAEEILRLRNEIDERFTRIREVRYTAPSCASEGCLHISKTELDDSGQVVIYNYCSLHKCIEGGCNNPRVITLYCKEHAPSSSFCIKTGCDNIVDTGTRGAKYCTKHKCVEPGCLEASTSGGGYCSEHFAKYYNVQPKSTYTKVKSRKTNKLDAYDVYDFDDPDDFADEWAGEFGDGNYDDGWDDAWDYVLNQRNPKWPR